MHAYILNTRQETHAVFMRLACTFLQVNYAAMTGIGGWISSVLIGSILWQRWIKKMEVLDQFNGCKHLV